MDTFPHDPRTIRARIRRYERALREEQVRFDGIRDGAGTRYMLGPLYLLLGDTAGALRSFAWFAKTFPDDSGDPVHLLCWTLACEFIPIKPLAAKGSDGLGSDAGHSRVPSRDRGHRPSTA